MCNGREIPIRPDSKTCIAPGRGGGGGMGGGRGEGEGVGREVKREGENGERGVNRLYQQEREHMQTCYTLAMTLFYPILYYMKYDLSYHGSGCCRRTGPQCLLLSAAPAQN